MKKKLTERLLTWVTRLMINDYTTGNLLDFGYYKENYRLIATDLSKQTKVKDPQQINFIGKIKGQNNGVTMNFIIEKSEETIFEFL